MSICFKRRKPYLPILSMWKAAGRRPAASQRSMYDNIEKLALGIFLRRLPALLKLRAHGLCEGWRNGIKLHQDHRNDH